MKDFQEKIDRMVSKILLEEIEKKSDEMTEKLHGDQHKLDVAKPKGKLTKADFKKLGDMKEEEDIEEQETEEGNYFSGQRADAMKKGEDSFEVDGKTYPVKESVKKKETKEERKWIQKTEMKKGALHKKLNVPEDEKIPQAKLKSLKKELMKKGEGDKKLSDSDSKLLKQVNLALTLKGLKENVQTLQLTEDELIDMIEKIISEQKIKSNIQMKTPIGLREVEKANKKTGQETSQQVKDVTKKLKEYLKDGSKEDFTMDPKHFPQGNGELDEKMTKKAYKPSDAVEEYIENFAYPGLENTHYDEIKPNDKWLEDNLVGSSKTGNNPEWANAIKTEVGEKANNKRKANLYQKEKNRSYKRVKQPVDTAGEGKGEKSLDNMFAKLESTENKKEKMINEEISKMMDIIKYNSKTQ
jgi:hypothetical protein